MVQCMRSGLVLIKAAAYLHTRILIVYHFAVISAFEVSSSVFFNSTNRPQDPGSLH